MPPEAQNLTNAQQLADMLGNNDAVDQDDPAAAARRDVEEVYLILRGEKDHLTHEEYRSVLTILGILKLVQTDADEAEEALRSACDTLMAHSRPAAKQIRMSILGENIPAAGGEESEEEDSDDSDDADEGEGEVQGEEAAAAEEGAPARAPAWGYLQKQVGACVRGWLAGWL